MLLASFVASSVGKLLPKNTLEPGAYSMKSICSSSFLEAATKDSLGFPRSAIDNDNRYGRKMLRIIV